jgi:hypothetical protein
VTDVEWGSTVGTVDLGAFGINVSQNRSSPLTVGKKQTTLK